MCQIAFYENILPYTLVKHIVRLTLSGWRIIDRPNNLGRFNNRNKRFIRDRHTEETRRNLEIRLKAIKDFLSVPFYNILIINESSIHTLYLRYLIKLLKL